MTPYRPRESPSHIPPPTTYSTLRHAQPWFSNEHSAFYPALATFVFSYVVMGMIVSMYKVRPIHHPRNIATLELRRCHLRHCVQVIMDTILMLAIKDSKEGGGNLCGNMASTFGATTPKSTPNRSPAGKRSEV